MLVSVNCWVMNMVGVLHGGQVKLVCDAETTRDVVCCNGGRLREVLCTECSPWHS